MTSRVGIELRVLAMQTIILLLLLLLSFIWQVASSPANLQPATGSIQCHGRQDEFIITARQPGAAHRRLPLPAALAASIEIADNDGAARRLAACEYIGLYASRYKVRHCKRLGVVSAAVSRRHPL